MMVADERTYEQRQWARGWPLVRFGEERWLRAVQSSPLSGMYWYAEIRDVDTGAAVGERLAALTTAEMEAWAEDMISSSATCEEWIGVEEEESVGTFSTPEDHPVAIVLNLLTQEDALPARTGIVEGVHLGEEGLEDKYNRLLAALAEYGVRVERPDQEAIVEGPGFLVARAIPGTGVRPAAISQKLEALKLRLGLEASQNIRTYVDCGAVVLEIPKRDEERYIVDANCMWGRTDWPADSLYAPIGEDVTGDIVGIDFSSSVSPHLLIAGTTGSGKSVALETILLGLVRSKTPEQLKLSLIDPKGTELIALERLAHVPKRAGIDAEDAVALLKAAVIEMETRYQSFRLARVRSLVEYNRQCGTSVPWHVIVLDEYADLTADRTDRKLVEGLLKRLAQKARAAGIHCIVATQKPSAEIISTTIRSNLPAQLALRVKTGSDSKIILDEVGAETLAGKGDAFLNTAADMVRVQCAIHRQS